MDSGALQRADAATVTVRYGFKDVGTIIGLPAATLASLPATVAVPATYPYPAPGRTVFLQDTTGAGVLVTVSQRRTGPGHPHRGGHSAGGDHHAAGRCRSSCCSTLCRCRAGLP